MRWFNGLRAGSIDSFMKLTRAFGSRFITCRRVPRPLDSLFSTAIREGETLKTYSDRYWEMFNEIDDDFDDVAIRTFKVGLPTKHNLRKSLTKKAVRSVLWLMDRIDEYKRVEEDQQQSQGKAKVIAQERRDVRSERYNNNMPQRDFSGQSGPITPRVVNTVFREPVHQVLQKIQNEPYFKRPNKMVGDPMRRNQNLLCLYHREQGHTTEDCRTLWNHLERLVKEGRLKQVCIGLTAKEDSGYDVKRVVVNQGSEADIMYPDLFKGLNLRLEDLTTYDSPLISFEGKAVIPKGQIRLPVQSGP
ncbi:uncharacterized protein LOC142635099 [Castanea sativa]|uniref:uncharacterized protein LOC142635099 n=1 Tax=Castanea sativa TaxID=21020 RepID=UPI003F64C954